MKSWRKLFYRQFKEFQNEPLKIVKGALPVTLKGTLYRNTSVFLPRKSQPSGHWFDGDGAILKIHFRGTLPPLSSYKFIQTPQFKQEQLKQDYIYPSVGRTYNGSFLHRLIYGRQLKNVGNTSVLPLKKGSLLALWEGGQPYQMHPQTLQTFGLSTLQRGLTIKDSFSAHPKVCSQTNEIFNFGFTFGKNPVANFYKLDQTGKLMQKRSVEITSGQRGVMCHDFILAGRYLVLLVFPILNEHLFSFLSGQKPLMDCLKYRPDQGTHLLISDRDNNMKIVTNKIIDTTFYAWHYANGFVNDQGNIVFEACAYKNFNSFKELSINQLMSDSNLKDSFLAKLERFELNVQSGKLVSRTTLQNDFCEFPVVNDADVGQQQKITYIAIGKRKDDLTHGIGRYEEGKYINRYFPQGQYVGEPIFVQNPEKEKDVGWLLVLNHDGQAQKTLIEILDSITLESICSLELPSEISLSYHGKFQTE